MKRYSLIIEEEYPWWAEMDEADDGLYVLFSDHESALAAEQKRREEAQADNARLRDTLEGIRDLAQNPADHPLDRGQKTRERSAKEVCGEMSDTFLLIEGMADSALAPKGSGGAS